MPEPIRIAAQSKWQEIDQAALDRFWSYVTVGEGCWEWNKKTYGDGYPYLRINGRMFRGNRISYAIHYGPAAATDKVCHNCDNPQCVRPDHLFLGTQSDNMRDAYRKGRHNWAVNPLLIQRGDAHYSRRRPEKVRRGANHHNVKLTEAKVREIRQRCSSGESQSSISKSLGICQTLVSQVNRRKIWGHIP